MFVFYCLFFISCVLCVIDSVQLYTDKTFHYLTVQKRDPRKILPELLHFPCDVHCLSLATCEDPGVPENGIRRGNTFIDGDSVKYFCNRNYSLIGSSVIRCVKGKWSSAVPICKGMKQVESLLEKPRRRSVSGRRLQIDSNRS